MKKFYSTKLISKDVDNSTRYEFPLKTKEEEEEEEEEEECTVFLIIV
jgi:hypothetical protein